MCNECEYLKRKKKGNYHIIKKWNNNRTISPRKNIS